MTEEYRLTYHDLSLFGGIVYKYHIFYYIPRDSITDDEVFTQSEIRYLPMYVYGKDNSYTVDVDFSEMTR